jgi:predicted nucleic acid-binding protein
MGSSRLSSPRARIVADSSAIINLNATQCAAEILRALPERVIVVDIVVGELEDGRRKGRSDADMLAELRKDGLVEIDGLGNPGNVLFERLVVGPASATLDDGEAATIAYAVEHSLGVVVDDNKARRICREQYRELPIRCSVEIFQHPSVQNTLGRDRLSSAVLKALQTARMRVFSEHMGWVIDLIGDNNAACCRSLPRRNRSPGTDGMNRR